MYTLSDITQYLETIAPLGYQASYDNAGLIVGYPQTAVKGVLISLDVTLAVLQEAVQKQCNLIISHHPPIFRPVKKLVGDDITTRVITFAVEHQIGLYAIHTNLDHIAQGVNKKLGDCLGLCQLTFLAPLANDVTGSMKDAGAGMIGYLPSPLSQTAFLAHLKARLQLTCIRYRPTSQNHIHRVAICGGAGMALLPYAKAQKADGFVTADIKYHQFFQAGDQLFLADIGHYESEVATKGLLYELLSDKFANLALHQCTTITNPVSYYV